MTLLNKERLMIETVDRIGVFPKNKVTLMLGLPGVGKSTTAIKELQHHGVIPIWFNLDHSDTTADKDKIDMFDDKYLSDLLMCKIGDIKGRVVVIDTYTRLDSYVRDEMSAYTDGVDIQKFIVNRLELLANSGVTVIVLAHPEDYVGRDGIFKDNPLLARNCYELITIETRISTAKKELESGNAISYYTYIKKGRNYKGDTFITNWMRD